MSIQQQGGVLPPKPNPTPSKPVSEATQQWQQGQYGTQPVPAKPTQQATTSPVTPNPQGPTPTGYTQQGPSYQIVNSTTQNTPTGTETTYKVTPLTPRGQPEPTIPIPVQPAASLAYSTTIGVTTKQVITSGIPPLQNFSWKNLTPEAQAQVRQQTLELGLVAAAPVAFVVAPTVALGGLVIGAVTSPAISEGANLVQGKGFLSNNQLVNNIIIGGAGGAVFSVAGSEIIGELGLTGAKGIGAAAGRVGTNVALGAGAGATFEYTSTGKVSIQGPIEGAAFGATFGLASEAFSSGVPKVREYLPEQLGGYPKEPVLGKIGLPTIETKSTDTLDFSAKTINAYEKTLIAASIADPTDILIGRSIEPTPKEPGDIEHYTAPQPINGLRTMSTKNYDLLDLNNSELKTIHESSITSKEDLTIKNLQTQFEVNQNTDSELRAIQNAMKTASVIKGEYWENFDKAQTIVKMKPANLIAQELISGSKAEPTGISKVISDYDSGRTTYGHINRSQPAIFSMINPFLVSRAKPYYQPAQNNSEETETIYNSDLTISPRNLGLTSNILALNLNLNLNQAQIPTTMQLTQQTAIQHQQQSTQTIQQQMQLQKQTQIQNTDLISENQSLSQMLNMNSQDDYFRRLKRKTTSYHGELLTRKRKYPILTAKEFLGVDTIKINRRKKRFGDL